MPEHFRPVMTLLKRYPDSTIPELHRKLKEEVTGGAVHNRVNDLLKAGLVKRRRDGKFFRYSLSSPKP